MEQEQHMLQNEEIVEITMSDFSQQSNTNVNPTQLVYQKLPANEHVHSQNCQHQQGHSHNVNHQGHQHFHGNNEHSGHSGHHAGHHGSHGGGHHGHSHANCMVLLFVIILIVISFSMQHFYYNTVYEQFEYILVGRLIKFLTFMSIWSFIQSVKGDNGVQNIRSKLQQVYEKQVMKLKECFYCDSYQIQRVTHCAYCNQCIYKMSHHCFWTQNCVGYANQRSFFLFVWYSLLGCLINVYSNYLYTSKHIEQTELFSSHGVFFYLIWITQSIALITITPVLIGVVVSQFLFIINNTIPQEVTKKPTLKIPFFEYRKKYLEHINIYDRGQIQNLTQVFGNNILTFWMPLNKRIKNDIHPQRIAPTPNKYQIQHFYPNMRKAQQQRTQKMANFASQVRQLYEGMQVAINGKNVLLDYSKNQNGKIQSTNSDKNLL